MPTTEEAPVITKKSEKAPSASEEPVYDNDESDVDDDDNDNDGPQSLGTRMQWSPNENYIFVSILARHSVCNERQGLVLNHMSVDAKIINDVAKGLGGGVDIDELVRQLAAKYPAKKKEHRSHACINLITEMKKKIPRYSYQQLNNKHINMWTRTIAPFRQMFDCGSPYKGKSPFHRDCKRFIKVLLEFLSNMIANGVTQVDLQVFARRADKGCKLLEQWLTAMLATHGVGMVNFLYACGVRVATAFINGKNLKDRSAEETRFLNTELHTPKEVHTVLRAYMDRIATCEALDAIPTQPIIVDVAEAARANTERCRELALAAVAKSAMPHALLHPHYAAGPVKTAAPPGAAPGSAAHPGMVHPGMVHPGMMYPGIAYPGMVHPGIMYPGAAHLSAAGAAAFNRFVQTGEYARAPYSSMAPYASPDPWAVPGFHAYKGHAYHGHAGPSATAPATPAYQRAPADHWAGQGGAGYMPPREQHAYHRQGPGGRAHSGYQREAPLYHPYYSGHPPGSRAFHAQTPATFPRYDEGSRERMAEPPSYHDSWERSPQWPNMSCPVSPSPPLPEDSAPLVEEPQPQSR
ncbi:hypothetical protein H4R18_002231 [Coemansia javaensis]|uniref:Uncharacterized protein n=1 Tax=Coemansia javaensis TaxID=2761396 RepID=A0A9W8HBC7_9FUNG|nr:hypothetical protein H4R18_002231 [Coemansia javaensis]